MEVIPSHPRNYEYIKTFEGDPRKVIAGITRVCGKVPEETYLGDGIKILTYDCGDIIVDVVVAQKGVTMYVHAPGIKRIDYTAVLVGSVLGSVVAFLGGYFGSFVEGAVAGVGVYAGMVWLVRKIMRKGSRVVELFTKLTSL